MATSGATAPGGSEWVHALSPASSRGPPHVQGACAAPHVRLRSFLRIPRVRARAPLPRPRMRHSAPAPNSAMKNLIDEVDTAVIKWQALLENTNTAEDGTFVAMNEGEARGTGKGCCRTPVSDGYGHAVGPMCGRFALWNPGACPLLYAVGVRRAWMATAAAMPRMAPLILSPRLSLPFFPRSPPHAVCLILLQRPR